MYEDLPYNLYKYHDDSPLGKKDGCYPNLSQSMLDAASAVQKRLAEDDYWSSFDDSMSNSGRRENPFLKLLRFLRGLKYDVDKTVAKIEEEIDWRRKKRTDDLRKYGLDELLGCSYVENIFPHFPTWLQGEDKEGRPVSYRHFGNLDINKVLEKIDMSTLVRFHCWETEMALQRCEENCEKYQRNIEQFSVIVDAEGWGLRLATSNAMTFIKEMAYADNNYYPERLGKMIIVNAPMVLSGVWAVIQTFLDADTKAKIQIISKPEIWKGKIQEIIDINQIPAHYGGKAPDLTPEEKARTLEGWIANVQNRHAITSESRFNRDSDGHRFTFLVNAKHIRRLDDNDDGDEGSDKESECRVLSVDGERRGHTTFASYMNTDNGRSDNRSHHHKRGKKGTEYNFIRRGKYIGNKVGFAPSRSASVSNSKSGKTSVNHENVNKDAFQSSQKESKYATLIFPNGDYYEGYLCGGAPHGRGTLTKRDGNVYTGSFWHGAKHGDGEYIYIDDHEITSINKDNTNSDGDGKSIVRSGYVKSSVSPPSNFNITKYSVHRNGFHGKFGNKFIGSFKDDAMHGDNCKQYLMNGDSYIGSFRLGHKCGLGTYRFADNVHGYQTYQGHWKHDTFDGQGKMTFTNKTTFEGLWENGDMICGVFTYNKYKYRNEEMNDEEGEGEDDKGSDKSKVSRINGLVARKLEYHFYDGIDISFGLAAHTYTGEMRNNQRNGQGKLTFYDSNKVVEGIFLDGILKKDAEELQDFFSKI
jgi:hypothetical protein